MTGHETAGHEIAGHDYIHMTDSKQNKFSKVCPVVVLGRKIWGTAPWRANVPQDWGPKGQELWWCSWGGGSEPRPQTHFGRIYSPENAHKTTCIMRPLCAGASIPGGPGARAP